MSLCRGRGQTNEHLVIVVGGHLRGLGLRPVHILMMTTIKERIDELLAQHGSYRAVGLAIMVSHPYLYRLHMGQADAPTEDVLDALGLRRIITYERSTTITNDPQGPIYPPCTDH